MVASAFIAGRQDQAQAVWTAALRAKLKDEEDRDRWIDMLVDIPVWAAPPPYPSIQAQIEADDKHRVRNQVRRIYDSLRKSGRCEEALAWMDTVPPPKWRTLLFDADGCEAHWKAFIKRHQRDMQPDEFEVLSREKPSDPDPLVVSRQAAARGDYAHALDTAYQQGNYVFIDKLRGELILWIKKESKIDPGLPAVLRRHKDGPLLIVTGSRLLALQQPDLGNRLLEEGVRYLDTNLEDVLWIESAVALAQAGRCRPARLAAEHVRPSWANEAALSGAYQRILDVCSGRSVAQTD